MKGKTFGFRTITFLVVANMIGAGVFTTSGFAIADLASPHLVLIAWFVGGGLALTGAVSYGMLIRVMPESGGEYLFLSRAAHPLLGFIAGWVSLIAGFSGAIAYAASAFVQYAVPDNISISPELDRILGIAAIVLAGLCHGIRPRVGAYAQNAVVFAKLWLLVGILVMAMWHWSNHAWPGFSAPLLVKPPIESAGLFAATLVWISLSYAGFNAAVYVADEVQDAERIIPKALLVGTMLVTLIYV